MSTTLNARRVHEALEKILAKKENAVITVTVKHKEEPAACLNTRETARRAIWI